MEPDQVKETSHDGSSDLANEKQQHQHHPASDNKDDDDDDDHDTTNAPGFFGFMARNPWPFLVLLPALFGVLLGIGWFTTDERVEKQVSEIWIPQKGDYAKDREYADSIGKGRATASSYAALALTRDANDNMMTAENLEAVRQRMEETEDTKLVFKGTTFTWDDFCGINSNPYMFPCLRLSPMDLYQESNWAFSTMDRVVWYRGVVQNRLINPRLARFGGLTTTCAVPCASVVNARFVSGNPLALFADVGNLEYNNVCKICLEESYTQTITTLHGAVAPAFIGLSQQVQAFDATLEASNANNTAAKAENERIITNLQALAASVTTNDVTEFYNYYVTRSLYGQLGAAGYLANYQSFTSQIDACQQAEALNIVPGLTCPLHPRDVNATTATADLLRQADGAFSSVTTAGAPFPFWSQADGTGALFQANPETGLLYPVSGSGVDMSGDLFSLGAFLQTSGNRADPSSAQWRDQVAVNPLYAWFMASLTPAEPETVCANGNLTGTPIDPSSGALLAAITPRWCTPFDVPNTVQPTPEGVTFTKQHFAKMWYDLLISSDGFLGVTQGVDDPYTWTTGAGCGYSLGGERFSYTGQSEQDIMGNSSRLIYNIDEGVTLGAVDAHLLVGGVTPNIGQYSDDNPIQEVRVLQNLYQALDPAGIVKRVKNCARPGGPVELTLAEAKELLIQWKEAMEATWNRGWDDPNDGNVEFVSFFDDGGAIGSTGRMLEEITLSNGTLTIVSILIITFFSAIFLFSFDLVESRVLITLVGVGLVVLSFFSALGFSLMTGIKINVTIGWTLPFVIIGLGVDDVYIILMALKNQGGYTLKHWLSAMNEVVVPVSMTSLVNACMFGILNVSDIPAIYLTSRVAMYCVIFLYFSVIFCFPAYCYLDLLRQKRNGVDIAVCIKSSNESHASIHTEDFRNKILYDSFYKPIVLNKGKIRYFFHLLILLISCGMFGIGCYGVTERAVGLGLADFFPSDNPAGRWAEIGQDIIASWSIGINWGAIDYEKPEIQMQMIKSFEDVVNDDRVGDTDTKQLWMAKFLIWTTRHCDQNFDRPDFDARACGRDQVFPDEEDSVCSGTWINNSFGLRVKDILPVTDDICLASEGGICRKAADMHPDDLAELEEATDYCPVVDGWSDEKWKFCINRWHQITGGGSALIIEAGELQENACGAQVEEEGEVVWPIPFSKGPTLFSHSMFTHEQTLDMIRDTRRNCDDLEDIHCWLNGIPYDYWTQYEDIFSVLTQLCVYATLGGFVISFVFLFGKLVSEGNHAMSKIFGGSLIGAALIACTMIITLTTVIGLSILSGVNLTGFSNMSFVLSIGFTVEYTVHIISRFMMASSTIEDRVDHTMSFLMLPTFMSFVSSTIGTVCLAFTEFEFIDVFFYRPLIIVMFVSYFYGCWFLPMILTYLDFDMLKLGNDKEAETPLGKSVEDVDIEGDKEVESS